MEKFEKLTGIAAPLPLVNIDTDMIIPKQFLKTIKRSGLGVNLFDEMRFDRQGNEIADFVLNKPQYRDAQILVAGDNFGCGSSREHAPWALLDYGFRAVISSSFADIFRNNALKNGLVPIVVDPQVHAWLLEHPGAALVVDIQQASVSVTAGPEFGFEIEPFAQYCLVHGTDQLGYLLEQQERIQAYESERAGA